MKSALKLKDFVAPTAIFKDLENRQKNKEKFFFVKKSTRTMETRKVFGKL